MEIGQVEQVDINNEMRSAYLDYAMSVIVSRALPDARDGLKPVHRRILYAMHDMGIRANTSHKKSARIVGEVLGKYHPHSDTAVYDAMARMAQDFSMRYPLVDGQGNFGSIGGDPPAAMRYTEARLAKMAGEMLVDIQKDTVDFVGNFDASLEEPSVLPNRLPNLLLNGSSGIAVGMASNIPPHNLIELTNAINFMIDNFENYNEITVDDLMEHVKGPDFPTGGIIVGLDGVRQIYSTGRGKITLRGKATIQEMRAGRHKIVITEIPYQVNQTKLIERIAGLVRNGKLVGISDLRDESDRRGMSINLELRKGTQPKTILNRLYKYTPLQSTFSTQLLALVNNEPLTLTLKRALKIYIDHRVEVINRRTEFDLKKAQARLHILDGLLIALTNIDKVIKTIRASSDVDHAKSQLMSKFKLSEIQTQAILDMQLRRLAALERKKIEDEHKEVKSLISYFKDLLAHPEKILGLIKADSQEMAEKYGDERNTAFDLEDTGEFNEEDLVKDEAVLITLTDRGYVKRIPAVTFRSQARGGKGVIGHKTKDKDEVAMLIPSRSKETLLFFSDKGKVYSVKAYRIPEASRTSKGTSILNILALGADETITAAVRVKSFKNSEYCIMTTKKGKTKRVALSQFESVRPSGLIAMNLAKGDELGWVRLTTGNNDVIIITKNGKALRFDENNVRAMGRQAGGVIGIKMRGDDEVTSLEVVTKKGELLIITEKGYGKRTPLDKYVRKGRGTLGVKTVDTNAFPKIGKIVAARVVQKSDELTIISLNGVVMRTKVENISVAGRATMGVRIMNINEGDSVSSLARTSLADLEEITEEK